MGATSASPLLLVLVATAAALATAASTGCERPTADYEQDICIVGAGPGGLQIASLMADAGMDFVLLEKQPRAGTFFEKYPIHRNLISINKRATGRGHHPEFNERHDWNSLVNRNQSLLVGQYSKRYYPTADEYVRYLQDFAADVEMRAPGQVHYDAGVSRVARTACSDEMLDLHVNKTRIYRCGRVVWATGMQPKGLDDVEGGDLDGVEFYSDIDPTNERYFNETVALIGAGNAGGETATALQNTAGYIALLSDWQFSWRSHYVGDLRSVNANFIDGYLLKSLDYVNPGSGRVNKITRGKNGKLIIGQKDEDDKHAASAENKQGQVTAGGDSKQQGARLKGMPSYEDMDASELEAPTNACSDSVPECQKRLMGESMRGMVMGFDRVIFCTGFRFKLADKKVSIFDKDVNPRLDTTKKYPLQNVDYRSRNVKGLYFGGALSHQRDYKRSAGGFVHGFRYAGRALQRTLASELPKDRPGAAPWPSIPLTKKEFIAGDHMIGRVNSMAGPYQMFGELCDLIVFERSSQRQCSKQKGGDDSVFARYYEEMPVSYMPYFVRHVAKSSLYMSICFEYGHGKFSAMDPLHHKYIGTRTEPIAEALGISWMLTQNPDSSSSRIRSGVRRPGKRLGPTGAGVDSNFLHPVFSIYDLEHSESMVSFDAYQERMARERSTISKPMPTEGPDADPKNDPEQLRRLVRADQILYPRSTHHLLEDLDTMWDLYYTHKLPLQWWLEDRSDPCDEFRGDSYIKSQDEEWRQRQEHYYGRAPHQLHVEVFCKDYEYERYLVRTARGDEYGRWKRPSAEGHIHRIPHKYSHFDLQPDGESSSAGTTGSQVEPVDPTALNADDMSREGKELKYQAKLQQAQQYAATVKEEEKLMLREIREHARIMPDAMAKMFKESSEHYGTESHAPVIVSSDASAANAIRMDEI